MRGPWELAVALIGVALWIFADGGWRTAGIALTLVGAALAVLHMGYLTLVVAERSSRFNMTGPALTRTRRRPAVFAPLGRRASDLL